MYKVIIVEDEDIIRKGLVYSVPWAEMDCNVVGEAANGIEGLVFDPFGPVLDVTYATKS